MAAPEVIVEIDYQEPIQSQYASAPHVTALARAFASETDPKANIDLFREKIFNPLTAEGYGLDIWGRIVGYDSRGVSVINEDIFGFWGSHLHTLDNAPFYNEYSSKGVFTMTDAMYRRLILYKAMANIGEETLATMNDLLNELFKTDHGEYQVFIKELESPMHVMIYFLFSLSQSELQIMKDYGLFCRGCGVGVQYTQVDIANTFGFGGSGFSTFGTGTFNSVSIIDID